MERKTDVARGGPIRNRSKKNSHPHEDLALRQRYREEFGGYCELATLLPSVFPPFPPSDIHHIWPAPRVDVWSNLISVSRPSHDWCGDHPIEGKICCMWVKLQKSKREYRPSYEPYYTREFDVTELDLAAQPKLVIGWLTWDDVRDKVAGTRFEPFRVELVAAVEKQEA